MKAFTLIPLSLLAHLSCAPARGAAGQDSAPPIDPVIADDGDGDGFPASTDCDDAAVTINPAAVEDCANAVDDDCDGHTDGGDTACPLEGEVETNDADVNLNGVYLEDTRPHPLPTDGTPTLWAAGDGTVDWYDFNDALAGIWTMRASVPGAAAVLESIPDVEGDGQTDLVGRSGNGAARYAGLPSAMTADQAVLSVDGAWFIGVTADLDSDGIEDFVVRDGEASTGSPFVAWFSSAATGVLEAAIDGMATLEVAQGISAPAHYYDVTRVDAFDADGDGVSETLLTQPGATDSYGSTWYHRGAVYVVPGIPSAASLEEGASAVVREEGWEFGVHDAGAVGDLDGDGYDDLAVGYTTGNWQDGSVLLYQGPFGGAHGSADALATLSGLEIQTGFSRGDMDADGVPELLVTGRRSDEVSGVFVFSDPAAGGSVDAAHLTIYSSGDEATILRDARLYDIDADGLDDILGTMVFYAR